MAPEEVADPDSRFATIDGVRIHYKDHLYSPQASPAASPVSPAASPGLLDGGGEAAGEPLTLLLLHGFNGSTFSWRMTKPGVGRAVAAAG